MTYAEPFRVKIVQDLPKVDFLTRFKALKEAGLNVIRIPRTKVVLDFSTTKGMSGMTDRQYSGLMIGDEAYAGSFNFYNLWDAAEKILGKKKTVPTHQGRGAENLILRHLLSKERYYVLTNKNIPTLKRLVKDQGGKLVDFICKEGEEPSANSIFKGNIDIDKLEEFVKKEKERIACAIFTTSVASLGGQVLELENFKKAVEVLKNYDIIVVLDVSQVASSAYFLKEKKNLKSSVEDIIKEYTKLADIIYMSAREDACCHTGGLIAVDSDELYVAFRSLVVVFEGLHTYGGQAGRDMQAMTYGLLEMTDEDYLMFRRRKLEYIERNLKERGLPLYYPTGTNGVMIDAKAIFEEYGHREGYFSETLASYLYLVSGVRFGPYGKYLHGEKLDLLGMMVPRRVYTQRHIDFSIEVLSKIKDKRLYPLELKDGEYFGTYELMEFIDRENQFEDIRMSEIEEMEGRGEPYIIRAVERIKMTDRERREKAIKEAGYNTFLLRSSDVYIDLLTDSGTSAMSVEQWGEAIKTMEAETGTNGYTAFLEAVREILGFRYVVPTHQGRAAEHVLSQTMIKPGQYVINNMYFTTTREHQEMAGGIFVDLIVDQAHDPDSEYRFKGDIDPEKLEAFIKEKGPENIAYVCLETNVNMAGGQPVSISNTKKISEICKYYGIPLIFDATRCAENAYFIKKCEKGYENWSIKEILRELFSLGDGCTISAKKDILVNIGGLIAVNDIELYKRLSAKASIYEGHPYQGGLASRDLMCMAVGLYEMVNYDYIASRVEQVQYLGKRLIEAGIPIVLPPGGHAIFLNARKFLDHLPQDHFPAQRLAAEIYLEGGVRTMERGIVSAGRDKKTGKHKYPKLELVRITIPRRVYTYTHMDIVAESIIKVYERRREIKGLRFVYEAPTLRFFTSRFESL